MSQVTTRRVLALHRWAGLLLSLNVLVFSVTGLLLIFHEEIDALLGEAPHASDGAGGTDALSLARVVELALQAHPGTSPVYLARDLEHAGLGYIGLGRGSRTLDEAKAYRIDLNTGALLSDKDLQESFTGIVFQLHAQLLAGPAGALIVGAIGVALLVLLISGVLTYGPTMRRLRYGALRSERSRRNFLADLHKLVGASTFGWLAVVTTTGILLSIGSPLLQLYATTELASLARGHEGKSVVTDLRTLDDAVHSAERASGGRRWSIALMPGSDLASPRHYSVLLNGSTGLDARMLTMAVVDATTPSEVVHRELPWYLRALLVSEPLHFGDYGGAPLRVLWALFTCALIALSVTGVQTFFSTRRANTSSQRAPALAGSEAGIAGRAPQEAP